MTGFRLARGGAVELFGVLPDLVTFGKVIGGGMPVGAFGGRREIMEKISPLGPVYQAGTLSGNPVAMTAGLGDNGTGEWMLEVTLPGDEPVKHEGLKFRHPEFNSLHWLGFCSTANHESVWYLDNLELSHR